MKKGFTLIELIIVIIIVGILATLAVPQYIKAVERAKRGKALNAIGLITRTEKMYRAVYDAYVNVADGSFNATLGNYTELTEVDADADWGYDVTGATGGTFLLTATRSSGPNAGETITMTESGVGGGNFTP